MIRTALSPINKTGIMYRANLSYSQLVKYLELLQDRDLIQIQRGQWVATDKGREFLDAYNVILRFVGPDKEVPAVARIV